MSPARPQKPTHLNDDALLARLVELNAGHRLSLTSLLEHIAEVDVRRLFAKRGHSSMHRYCVRELNMSDDEAYARIRVARLGRRLPSVLAYLADGRLHLTAARLLASHLTPENHRAVLAAASGLNVAAIKRLVARLAPRPDVPTRIRVLPAPRTAPRPTSSPNAELASAPATPKRPEAPPTLDRSQSRSVPPPSTAAPPSPAAPRAQVAPPSPAAPRPKVAPPLTLVAPRPIVAPLAPERFEVRFTASAELVEKLTEVTALLSHAVPDGDLPTVLERALELARTQLVKRRFGAAAVAEREGALVDGSGGAGPVAADAVEARDAETHPRAARPMSTKPQPGRPPASRSVAPRAEARPLASRPAPQDSAGRAPASRSVVPRDDARPLASRPAPEDSAGRASASRSVAPRDDARPLASRPAPEDLAERAPASRSVVPRDDARPRASRLGRDDESVGRGSSRSMVPRDEARPLASRPAPEDSAGRASTAEGPSPASRCGARRDHLVSKPAPTREPPAERSRYIPAAVRAEVWRRDEGRCTYVDPETGHACDERRFLELHHEHPFAHGGVHAVEVLTLRCRAHNIWAARLDFGADHIEACIARR